MKKYILFLFWILNKIETDVAQAEIPFNQALGVYEKTRVEYKYISPFWGMVAIHGKLLERIRFFGHYNTQADKQGRQIDVSQDSIAQLIQRLFPSPDGIYLVANTNNQDPVGNLSRHLERINDLIEILESKNNQQDTAKNIFNILKPLDKNTKNKDIQAFAELLAQAYESQAQLANPDLPAQQLYPENIVIISLLGFFCKIADSSQDFQKLPLLIPANFTTTAFTLSDYFGFRKQGIDTLDNIISNATYIPEIAFLMAKGYEFYENPFTDPIQYRSDTCFMSNQKFPDCGETSLRNILMIMLGEKGIIPADSLILIQKKITPLSGVDLQNESTPFQQMVNFFLNYPLLAEAATKEVHDAWANLISDLNQQQSSYSGLEEVQYGRGAKNQPYTYEIKSNFSNIGVNGIINMLNVISKIIPDQQLNEPWSKNEQQRLQQASLKLTRFCDLLSREGHTISWKNEETSTQTLHSPFAKIIIMINDQSVYTWTFDPGHFQLTRIVSPNQDWRLKYSETTTFPNDWLAALYVTLDEGKFLRKPHKGQKLPLALIYNSELKSLQGALKNISVVLYQSLMYQNLEQFLSLISHWIDKSIPLNDDYALKQISLLLYTIQDSDIGNKVIDHLLTHPKFQIIINRMKLWDNISPTNLIKECVKNQFNTELILMAKKLGKNTEITLDLSFKRHVTDFVIQKINEFIHLTSLNLSSNSQITDKALEKLTNVVNLDLSFNVKITDVGLSKLTGLHILNLSRNALITNSGVSPLRHLISLDLSYNNVITDAALHQLKKLIAINLADNDTITSAGLQALPNLTSLNLAHNSRIQDQDLQKLTQLLELDLSYNSTISDKGIQRLTKLIFLNLSHNSKITDNGLRKLSNLRQLILRFNLGISDKGLNKMPNLTYLDLTNNQRISAEFIKNHPKIEISR